MLKKGGTPTNGKMNFKNVESRLFQTTKSIKDKYGSRYSSEDEGKAVSSKSPTKGSYYAEKEDYEKKP